MNRSGEGERSAAARVRAIDWAPLAGLALRAPLEAVLAGEPAERVLDKLLRGLGAAQRKAVAEAVFGVGLWRRRLARQAGTHDALALLDALTHLADDPLDFADRHSLPDWLAAELLRTPQPDALADALNQPGPICLRARGDRDALARELRAHGIETRHGLHAPHCLVVTSDRPNLLGLDRADFEVQDEGSQLLGERVGAQPSELVLDLCAGAGGKTLQLAAAGATVHAFDVDLAKLERLRQRAERAGHPVVIHRALPDGLRFDRVLVDAPCSELGALRRGPDLRWRIDPATFHALLARQLELLRQGAHHTKPGGRLVYGTCTFRREENEDVCERFGVPPREQFRCWPHVEGTDAFFGAVYELH